MTRALAAAAVFFATAGASSTFTFFLGVSVGRGSEASTVSCEPPMTKNAPPITSATSIPSSAKTLMAGLTVRATASVSAANACPLKTKGAVSPRPSRSSSFGGGYGPLQTVVVMSPPGPFLYQDFVPTVL